MSTDRDLEAVASRLRREERFVVTSHDNPDGDAIGSLLALHLALEELGKDSVMVMGGPAPFPEEFGFLALEANGLVREPPSDVDRRVLVAVDCAQASRIVETSLVERAATVVNIDHHHDNSRFGAANLVVEEASSTAEVLADVFAALPLAPTPAIAEALYVGLVTDTGRFAYENTSAAAHRMAAELIEAGVSPHLVHRRLFEDLPYSRLLLLARALASVARYDDGVITVATLTCADFDETGALETDSEGIVDHLRAVEGTAVAVLIRDQICDDRRGWRKASLRATDHRVDVSRIARALGGGGHRQAAGFSTELAPEDILSTVREHVAEQLQP